MTYTHTHISSAWSQQPTLTSHHNETIDITQQYQASNEQEEVTQQSLELCGHGILDECAGDDIDFVGDDDKDEWGDDDVEYGVRRNEHKDAMGVGRHPDVVLTNKQLQLGERERGKAGMG